MAPAATGSGSAQTVTDDDQFATESYQTIELPPFDPSIHLAFEAPTARHSFTELGLKKPKNAPDICYTEPFQLFSEEGVRMIRRDLLRREVLDKHLTSWDRAPCYIAGHEKACFIFQYHSTRQ